jgi:hypothetical protein
VIAGDLFATSEDQLREEVLNFYQTAVTTAPYPTLHNELGAIFLYRSGIQPDAIGSDEDLVMTINDYGDHWKHADLVSDQLTGMLTGPVMPEYRNQLLQIALECYSSAYGYFTQAALSTEWKRAPQPMTFSALPAWHSMECG